MSRLLPMSLQPPMSRQLRINRLLGMSLSMSSLLLRINRLPPMSRLLRMSRLLPMSRLPPMSRQLRINRLLRMSQ
jgi:hypothetical protein